MGALSVPKDPEIVATPSVRPRVACGVRITKFPVLSLCGFQRNPFPIPLGTGPFEAGVPEEGGEEGVEAGGEEGSCE